MYISICPGWGSFGLLFSVAALTNEAWYGLCENALIHVGFGREGNCT